MPICFAAPPCHWPFAFMQQIEGIVVLNQLKTHGRTGPVSSSIVGDTVSRGTGAISGLICAHTGARSSLAYSSNYREKLVWVKLLDAFLYVTVMSAGWDTCC